MRDCENAAGGTHGDRNSNQLASWRMLLCAQIKMAQLVLQSRKPPEQPAMAMTIVAIHKRAISLSGAFETSATADHHGSIYAPLNGR
jgi:hypothetical protein